MFLEQSGLLFWIRFIFNSIWIAIVNTNDIEFGKWLKTCLWISKRSSVCVWNCIFFVYIFNIHYIFPCFWVWELSKCSWGWVRWIFTPILFIYIISIHYLYNLYYYSFQFKQLFLILQFSKFKQSYYHLFLNFIF